MLEALEGHLRANLAKLEVSIATSRGPESLTAFAAAISATPVSALDAAKAGEVSSSRSQRKPSPILRTHFLERSRQRRGGRNRQLPS